VTDYLKVERSKLNGTDPFWPAPGEKHTRGEAWIDCHYLADETLRFNGSVRELAIRWDWSKDAVQRFLVELLELGRINRVAEDQLTRAAMYRIVQTATKKVNNTSTANYEAEFDKLWPAWKGRPNNSKKAGLEKYIVQRRKGVSWEELRDATIAYYEYCQEEDSLGTKYMLMAQTFFGPHERWKGPWEVRPRKAREQLKQIT
jgi:hypothetical protein